MSYLTHLECSRCGERFAADAPRNHECKDGGLLFARYDLARLKREVTAADIAHGACSLWRYAPLLPAADPGNAVTLGEGWTPLLKSPRLAQRLGCRELWVKDEGRNPSGTFKDRGAAVALTRYRELGVKTVALNSSGNAGGAWALYAARADIACVNLLPSDAQPASRKHCSLAGALTYLVEDWHAAGRFVAEACAKNGWFNVCTLKEPYRAEGKKTMGLEIAEQLGWRLPDAIVYPMGGGLGAIAIYKAFDELRELGWISGGLPRLIVTQYEGCAPVVKAFEEDRQECEPWGEISILPGGLKSPNPPGGRHVLKLMRETSGAAIAVSTDEALAAVAEMARAEGIFACPESATTLVGLRKALARGIIRAQERVVLMSTGSGLKSIPSLPEPRELLITSSAGVV
ncbi:MAG: threonine synthase [Betaproteobacteria bacterium]|nr:threonine synthase [Betaproteobacteria bacterium]